MYKRGHGVALVGALIVLLGLVAPAGAKPLSVLNGGSDGPKVSLKAHVDHTGETLAITNHDRFAWKRVRFYIDCMNRPQNFTAGVAALPPGKTVRLSVRSFVRPPSHGTPRFNPDIGNTVVDFLIVCDTPRGRRKGYWYGY